MPVTTVRDRVPPAPSARAGHSGARRWHLGFVHPIVGALCTLVLTLASPKLVASGSAHWWFSLSIPPGRAGNMTSFYVALVGVGVTWLSLGRRIRENPDVRPHEVTIVAALWAAPLLVAPALFSSDMYSYLAQGALLHAGVDPYKVAPLALAHLGHRPILDAVSPFWRSTTAPYGPLFIGAASLIVAITGNHLVAGVLALRGIEVVGIGLLAVFLPRLARLSGADPTRALWLTVASPLVLLELVGAGHNDALMVGLMVAGVTLALEGRHAIGIACCLLAATVKAPAAVAALFCMISWWRDASDRSARRRIAFASSALIVGVLAIVSAATGVGVHWLSSAVISAPGKVHLAITPVTAFGSTIARIAHGVGLNLDAHHLESVLGDIALVVTAFIAVRLATQVRSTNLVPSCAIVLVAAALAGPAAWPWYFCWGLVLFAALAASARSDLLALAIAAAPLLVKPDGILAIPLGYAPLTATVFLVLAAFGLRALRRGGRRLIVRRAVAGT